MWKLVTTSIGALVIAICFFIAHVQVVSLSLPSSRISYFFNPECGSDNETLDITILQAMNCYNNTMGCNYDYISVSVRGYEQVTHKPWFAPLAIFTIIWIVLYILSVAITGMAITCGLVHPLDARKKSLYLKWIGSIFVVVTMSLILACYFGYMSAPNIRICSPPQRPGHTSSATSRDNRLIDSFDDLLAGCSYVFSPSTTPTKQWILDNIGSVGCKNFQYFVEGDWLEATIALQSSPHLKQQIIEGKDRIQTLLYVAIAAALVIVLPHLVECLRSCRFCHRANAAKVISSSSPPPYQ